MKIIALAALATGCIERTHLLICGDGVVTAEEVCDDGNVTDGDGCSATCDSTEQCGNARIDTTVGEQCDDGAANVSSDGCSSRCLLEVDAWRDATPLPIGERTGHALVYDSRRGISVLFGGQASTELGETWEWDGTTWALRQFAIAPPPRVYPSMTYDSQRDRVILFGGSNADGMLADTWEYDGASWTRMTPPASPPARARGGMTYDSLRQRVVLFGGLHTTHSTGPLADTWEWDGAQWIETTPASSPPPATITTLGYHVPTARVIMLASTTETWAYDGTSWTRLEPATVPPTGLAGPSLAYDSARQRLVTSLAYRAELWEFDGSNWSSQAGAIALPNRIFSALTYDEARGVSVVFGGAYYTTYGAGILYRDTWEWTASGWAERTPAPATPPSRFWTAAAYDSRRGRGILFGGTGRADGDYADTWSWARGRWVPIQTPTTPPGRSNHAMVYDTARDRFVLFGGFPNSVTYLGDTWEFDGATWIDRTPPSSPPGRWDPGMTYDEARSRVLLFGGYAGISTILGDTWEYDGMTWTQRTPSRLPPPRRSAVLVYDPLRERTLLFGGRSFVENKWVDLNDTWEWDGTDWTELAPAISPSPRAYAAGAFDPMRRRIVVVGGDEFATLRTSNEVWEWDGTTWTLSATVDAVSRESPTLFYDAVDRVMVLFGGRDLASRDHNDTWIRELTSGELKERCLLADEDRDGDGLAGCADPDCFGRCVPTCAPNTSCPATAPRCGDGSCSLTEDAQLCPADC